MININDTFVALACKSDTYKNITTASLITMNTVVNAFIAF